MKQAHGWAWPDHEMHLIDWITTQKPPVVNGRLAYQGLKQLAVKKHCRQFRTAVDVGAHVGLWAYNLAHWFKQVKAFEPVDEHRKCFIENTIGQANITLHPCALGAIEGSVNIATTHGSSGDSRVQGEGDIPMHRLDSFGLQSVDLIKIDVEGLEEGVILGALDTIVRCHPTIIVEQKRDFALRFGLEPQGALKVLHKLGYKTVTELGGDFILTVQ